MQHRALQNALEAGGGARLLMLAALHAKAVQLVVEVGFEVLPQLIEIDLACMHDARGVFIIDQRQQQMLKRHILVFVVVRERERAPERLFKRA